jgi:antitoxin component of MazEF toxin-antitoxin module
MAITRILRDGKDLLVEVPEEILLTLGIGVGQKLHVSLEDNKIILDPLSTDDTARENQY